MGSSNTVTLDIYKTSVGTLKVPRSIMQSDDKAIEQYIAEHVSEVEINDIDWEWDNPEEC